MNSASQRLHFLLDEGVPLSVGRTIEGLGHDVTYFLDALPPSSRDEVVFATARRNDAILVAIDGDMKRLTKRFGKTDHRFTHLDLVMLPCGPVLAAARLANAMELVELEWRFKAGKAARRLWVAIDRHHITTWR